MPSYPIWINEADGVFLREVARGLFVGAQGAASVRPWDLVVDLHGIELVTAGEVLVRTFSDGEPFPPAVLDEIYAKTERVLDQGGVVLLACEMGRSRSASAAYAMLRTIPRVGRNDAYNRIATQMTIPTGTKRKLSMTYPRRTTYKSASDWAETRLEQLRA